MTKKTTTKRGPNKLSQAENIRRLFNLHPDKTVSEIAKIAGVKYQIAYMARRSALKQPKKPVVPREQPMQIEMFEPPHDPVNHPAHYKVGGIETIDFIEAKKLNYNLGNAVKYITRADHKGNRKQDLEKALWYIKRELSAV